MIKANFSVKKVDQTKSDDDVKKLEALIERGGVGSHMVFRNKDDDELFIDEL